MGHTLFALSAITWNMRRSIFNYVRKMCTALSRVLRLILESMQMDEMFQWASRSSQDLQNFLSLWPSLHWSGFGRDDNYYVSVSLLRNYATRFASWFSICGKTRRTAGEQIVVLSLNTQHNIESQWCTWLSRSALGEEVLYNGISLRRWKKKRIGVWLYKRRHCSIQVCCSTMSI